jgi:hypothetical protein
MRPTEFASGITNHGDISFEVCPKKVDRLGAKAGMRQGKK